jgi:toxin FitB
MNCAGREFAKATGGLCFNRTRLLPIDVRAAMRWGALTGESEKRGLPLPVIDSLIAATALVHGFAVVTRNVEDFKRCGVACVNPWDQCAKDLAHVERITA